MKSALALAVLPGLCAVLLGACGEDPPRPVEEREKEWAPLVDGQRALERVRRLVELGPRVPGTPGGESARLEIKAQLSEIGVASANIQEQAFKEKITNVPELGEVEFTNIVGIIPGKSRRGMALSCHYDSKRFQGFKFVGANDAGSAVGVLLEVGRLLVERSKVTPMEQSVYLVFFDGEEDFSEEGWGQNTNLYGSRHMALNMGSWDFSLLVNVDMVGRPNIRLSNDQNSSPDVRAIFKDVSKEVFGINIFVREMPMVDDHMAFQGKMPIIDLIDHEYETSDWWHKPTDTLDRLDTRSLAMVGTLILTALPRLQERFQ